MTAPADAFVGLSEATLETGLQWRLGLAVSFPHAPCRGAPGRDAVRRTFAGAATAMPFATVIDGRATPRRKPIDVLIDARGRALADAVVSRTAGDCLITVGRFEDGERAGVVGPAASDQWSPHPITVTADMNGTAIALDADTVSALHPALTRPLENRLVVRAGTSWTYWREVVPAYVAVLEAVGSETLATRLADRRKLVMTEALGAVGRMLLEMVAELAAGAARNAVPADSPIRAAARASGMPIPAAQVVAHRPRGRSANTSVGFAGHGCHWEPVDCDPMIVLEGGLTVHRSPALLRDGALMRLPPFGPTFSMLLGAASGNATLERLVEAEADLPGIAVASEADLIVDGRRTPIARGGRFGDEDIATAWAALGRAPGMALAQRLALEVRTGAGRRTTIPLSFAVVDASGPVESHAVVVTPSAAPVAVVEALVNASPWYDPRLDDGWTTQLHRFRDQASRVVRRATGRNGARAEHGI